MSSPRLLTGRRSAPGNWYALTTITRDRRPLFTHPGIAAVVLDELRSIPADTAESHAWVLMPDHLHWLLRLGERLELGRLVQQFKSRSAIAINRLRQVSTPVWQQGFYDHQLRQARDLAAQARYIVGNPIRRGICERIEDYPYWWSRWVSSSEDLL